jgi:hypothetical protein
MQLQFMALSPIRPRAGGLRVKFDEPVKSLGRYVLVAGSPFKWFWTPALMGLTVSRTFYEVVKFASKVFCRLDEIAMPCSPRVVRTLFLKKNLDIEIYYFA